MGDCMNKFIAMTALALILSVSAAHAEYTGGGAIAPSGGVTAAPKASLSISGKNVDDAKEAVRERWQNFKNNHADDWQKLEAARRAHWRGAKTDTATPSSTEGGSGDNGGWDGSSNTAEGMPAEGEEPERRPSKWETFKAKHPDAKETIKAGAENARGNLGVAKDQIRNTLHEFGEKHHDNVDAAKDNYRHWKDEHQDTIDAAKDKAAEWKENHQGAISAAKGRVEEWKGNHADTIDAAKSKWQDWKERHSRQ
jgi:hypothetical protein